MYQFLNQALSGHGDWFLEYACVCPSPRPLIIDHLKSTLNNQSSYTGFWNLYAAPVINIVECGFSYDMNWEKVNTFVKSVLAFTDCPIVSNTVNSGG